MHSTQVRVRDVKEVEPQKRIFAYCLNGPLRQKIVWSYALEVQGRERHIVVHIRCNRVT